MISLPMHLNLSMTDPLTTMQIIILTGQVRSAKTTALQNWLKGRSGAAGILSPDIGKLRKFYDIASEDYFDFQIDENTNEDLDITRVGRFTFLDSTFKRANDILRQAGNSDADYIIIDELGKLELKKKGLYTSIKYLLDKHNKKELKANLLIVIRDYLLEDAIHFFDLKHYRIVELDASKKLQL